MKFYICVYAVVECVCRNDTGYVVTGTGTGTVL